MFIKKAEIKNFRNIREASFDFTGMRSAFEGRNHIGKTNCLEAIHWVISDFLINGSSDIDSILPSEDSRKTCSVKLTLDDGATIEKFYKEKWTKTRGSDTETLTGHELYYVINGITQKTKSGAISEIHRIIAGGEEGIRKFDNHGIDLYHALINPLYLTEQIPWQDFRSFIIQLVGNIKDDDVFAKNANLLPIRDDLNLLQGRTDMLSRKYFDEERNLMAQKKEEETAIEIYSDKKEPSADDIKSAGQVLDGFREQQRAIRNGQTTTPEQKLLESEISSENDVLSKLSAEIISDNDILSKQYHEESDRSYSDYQNAVKKLDGLNNSKNNLAEQRKKNADAIEDAKARIQVSADRKNALGKQYLDAKNRQFEEKQVKCPKCGAVLNDEELTKHWQDFENNRQADLERITMEGKAEATEISKQNAIIESLSNTQLIPESSLDGEIAKTSAEVQRKKEIMNSITPKKSARQAEYDSEKEKLNGLISRLSSLNDESLKSIDEKLNDYIKDSADAVNKAKGIQDAEAVYKDAQKSIAAAQTKLIVIKKGITQYEEMKAILNEFIIKKLSMVNESTKKVFPDIDFVLIEDNIKEGSFNEVCYPLIPHRDAKIPYADGSSSEKVLTGIAITEDIRKYLDLGSTPVIFDEGETLDSISIASIDTECQIITSVVNDRYDNPTLIGLGKETK